MTPGLSDQIEVLGNELKNSSIDPSSFAKPDQTVVKHAHLKWLIDFNKKVISGHVVLSVERLKNDVGKLVLDTWGLTIFNVSWLDGSKRVRLAHELYPEVPEFGSKFEIDLVPIGDKHKFDIQIDYTTSPNSAGLAWMTPEMTQGKRLPFVFSQFEAITARSALPCQDTPSVKMTYSAEVSRLLSVYLIPE